MKLSQQLNHVSRAFMRCHCDDAAKEAVAGASRSGRLAPALPVRPTLPGIPAGRQRTATETATIRCRLTVGRIAVEALLARGCEVTLVTRFNRLMPLLESAPMETTVRKRLGDERFEFIGDSKVVELRSDHVVVQSIYGQRTRCVEAISCRSSGPAPGLLPGSARRF